MSTSRQQEERMWELAYEMARSGKHRDYQSIEWELRVLGHVRAEPLMDRKGIREQLNRMCDEARKGKADA
jgi:hypothetical protein